MISFYFGPWRNEPTEAACVVHAWDFVQRLLATRLTIEIFDRQLLFNTETVNFSHLLRQTTISRTLYNQKIYIYS